MKKTLLIWICVISYCSSLSAHGIHQPVFYLDSICTYKDLTAKHVSYWIDEAEDKDINYIIQNEHRLDFLPSVTALPKTKQVFWCKWQIQNVMKEPTVVQNWILNIGKADYMDVYFVNTAGKVVEHQRVGELVPMSEKALYRKHIRERIPFSLPTGELTTMYIRMQRICGFPPKIRLELYQQDFYKRDDYQNKAPVRWLFFGMLFTLAFLGIGFYPITDDKAFFYYGVFLLSLGAYMIDAFFNKYGSWSFFREHPKWIMYWVYAIITVMNVSHVLFIREYISSKIYFPRWDRLARYVVWGNIIVGVGAIVFYGWTTDEFLTDKVIIPVIIATYIFLFTIIIPILKYRRWSVENLLIFISVTLFTVAVLINAISIFNGTNLRLVETQLLLTLVILIFAIGLAFGLAYRLHRHQKETQEVLRLQDLNTMKAQFYQNITHEFRTPLTVISGLTEQLKDDASISRAPAIAKKITTIRRNGKNLLNLVNRLLEMARLETGKMELTMGNGDLVLYLRYLVESIETFAEQKQVKLQVLTNLESLTMDYDQEKIRQVMYNLLSNAIKFSNDNGRIKILIEKKIYQNKAHLLVQVKDEGIGIAAKDLIQVFDRFYQAKQNKTAKNEGSGIGLALTRELVQLMKGEIRLESELGKGTVASLYLPITNEAPAHEQAAPVVEEAKVEASKSETQLVSKKTVLVTDDQTPLVLLVEDNWDVLEFVQGVLDKTYQIEIARDGQQGIDQAIEKIPDLIISDVKMPEKNGYELTAFLKNDPRTSHIPIILLTAKNTEQDKIEGLTHGADAYLTKPFSPEELEIRVRNILAHRQKLQEKWTQMQATSDLPENSLSEKDRNFLEQLTTFIEDNIADEDLDVARMQRAVHMSRPQLHRKLKAITGLSAAKFRKKIRMQKAYKLLKEKNETVAEIAYQVGYKYPTHFSSDFKEAFGMPPGQV